MNIKDEQQKLTEHMAQYLYSQWNRIWPLNPFALFQIFFLFVDFDKEKFKQKSYLKLPFI